jgi:hypothetical protein
MSPSSSTGISVSCLAKEIIAARGSGKEGQVKRVSLAALRKANSSTLERPVKKRAKRDVVEEETSLTEMREKEERAMIKVDSTVVRSTQKPLICTRLSEGDITSVFVSKGG